ncbi:hypothetical protein GX888_01420 [Candidatus Dojkabacteria bacterium]|uniref:DUF916 domain-containing protein n=1 Tax=Candidatus Dojkabacteria bacterium TaxID=2099670 RepID=A0A847VD27_9BACT|nr:hypothetical protein [Candidatus Dojkabacteria bacterium]
MKLINMLKFRGFLILSLLILLSSTFQVHAQKDLAIGVAPTSKLIKLSPDEVYSDEVVFWNLTQSTDTYKVFIKGFRQIENHPGTAVILTEEEEANSLYSASKWVTAEKDTLSLEPHKNTKLKYTIKVPKDTTPGEYNVEIFLISESEFNEKGTATFANLASGVPILIQIGDEYVQNAELLKFITDKKIYEKIDVTFLSTIKNLGNTHIKPSGDIVVTNIFKQEVARVPYNNHSQSLLRDNTGNFEDTWQHSGYLSLDKAIILGPMTATALITYKTPHPGFSVLSEETTFWVIPWKIIFVIIMAILLIIMFRIIKKKIAEKQK